MMNNYKKSTMLGYFRLLIHYVGNFMLVPIMLLAFGDSEYGVYKIMTSVSAYFIIADGGLSNTSLKFLTEARIKNDEAKRKNFCFIALGYYSIVSLALMLVGVMLYIAIPSIYKNSLDASEIQVARKMVFPLVVTYSIKLFTSLFRGYIKSYEKYNISKWGELIQEVLRFGLIYAYIKLLHGGVVGCVIIDLVVTLALLMYYMIYSIRDLHFSISRQGNNRTMYKSVFSFSGAILMETIAFQVFWSADSVLLGIMTSASTVTIYSISTTMNGYFQSISTVSNEFLMPEIIKLNTSDMEVHFKKMITYARLKLALLGLVIVGIVLLGKEFIFVWIGAEYEEAYGLLLILMVPQLFIQIMDYIGNLMLIMEKHYARAKIMIGVAAANICLTIAGIARHGMYGAAISTAISMLAGQGLAAAIYYWKVLKIDMWNFYKSSFSKIWICIAGLIAVGKIIGLGNGHSWLGLILQIVLVSFAYGTLTYLFCFTKEERKYIFRQRRKK